MKLALSFSDVLITPKFSHIKSRRDVDTSIKLLGRIFDKAVVSSNMDTVTECAMADAMFNEGAAACLHRFMSLEDNLEQYRKSPQNTWVSLGLGVDELERAKALYLAGADTFVIDVAHGASIAVVQQLKALRSVVKDNGSIVVGNFATADSIVEFLSAADGSRVDAWKIGIGGGAVCTTRVVTGAGYPTFASILDCSQVGVPIIADGGIRNGGDYCKALAAGASMVMLGKLLAGTTEAPGDIQDCFGNVISAQEAYENRHIQASYKKYRGSASKESYIVQGKEAEHRTEEGISTTVLHTGSVKDTLQTLDASLRSSMSYVGTDNIKDYQERADFVQITGFGAAESKPHGRMP